MPPAIFNLALLYQKQERLAEAEPLFARTLSIRENILGENLPEVAATLMPMLNCFEAPTERRRPIRWRVEPGQSRKKPVGRDDVAAALSAA